MVLLLVIVSERLKGGRLASVPPLFCVGAAELSR